MRPLHRVLWALGLAGLALTAAACDDQNDCQKSGGVLVCGDFGQTAWTADLTSVQNGLAENGLAGAQTEWPPVAIADGKLILSSGQKLIEVSAGGKIRDLTDLNQPLTVPSRDEQGNVYVLGGQNSGSTVRSYQGANVEGQTRWQTNVAGAPVGTPPTVGKGRIYVATRNGTTQTTLYTLDRNGGQVVAKREGASPAAVMADQSVRYLSGPKGVETSSGTVRYGQLVAEGADGTVLWTWTSSDSILDFAPGPKGETYVVTGTHLLQRVSAEGKVEWSFTPPCNDCTVAAAPTVTSEVVYFPVWEKREQPIDPLYALNAKTGAEIWTFDGFFTKQSKFSPYKALAPSSGSSPVDTTKTLHHPAGRPVVAKDGTLYVSSDGAVTALDKNGQVLGVALHDANVGEVGLASGFMAQAGTWINPGVRPSPVLGPDGTLYTWDGQSVRAYHTGRQAEPAAWIAPFGGPDNSGRLPE